MSSRVVFSKVGKGAWDLEFFQMLRGAWNKNFIETNNFALTIVVLKHRFSLGENITLISGLNGKYSRDTVSWHGVRGRVGVVSESCLVMLGTNARDTVS